MVQPEPSSAQAVALAARRTEEDAPEASLAIVVMGQASASMVPATSTIKEAAPEEVLPQEESAPLGAGAEPP